MGKNGSDWRVCMRGAAALRFMRTPTFVLNSIYNWCPAFFMLKIFAKNVTRLEDIVASYRSVVIDAMAPALDPRTPHGVFSDSCDVHVESSVDWNKVRIN